MYRRFVEVSTYILHDLLYRNRYKVAIIIAIFEICTYIFNSNLDYISHRALNLLSRYNLLI